MTKVSMGSSTPWLAHGAAGEPVLFFFWPIVTLNWAAAAEGFLMRSRHPEGSGWGKLFLPGEEKDSLLLLLCREPDSAL